MLLAFLVLPVYNFIMTNVVNRCCRSKKSRIPYTEDDFYSMCRLGNINNVELALSDIDYTETILNKGLIEAVRLRNEGVAKYLIENGANNLDECLKISCQTNNLSISEMLVQKGARTVIGLRYATSRNIIDMLYRYEQKSEKIG